LPGSRTIAEPPVNVEQRNGYVAARFRAMASPCEVFIDHADVAAAQPLGELAAAEALRIERKFSRFRDDNIVHRINHSDGERIEVDAETAQLLDFAAQCYAMSEGLFDVTAGVLRKVWRFDGSDHLPHPRDIDALLPSIGWDKVTWQSPYITLPPGMEIDLGGIGKEYAVDRTLLLLCAQTDNSVLVNFGGDLHVSGPRRDDIAWQVGVEHSHALGSAMGNIAIARGALTTSGDSHRYVLKDGIRYTHVLNPQTGWPVPDAPHAVTVAADTCIEAGILSTLALLKGKAAEHFLDAQSVRYCCQR